MHVLEDVCLVVPCYNEAERLPTAAFLTAFATHPRLRLCLVNDGSSDHTLQVLTELATRAPGRIRVIDLPRNVGKAEAVRQGMLATSHEGYRYTGYWDADLSTPLSEIDRFVEVLDHAPDIAAVFGCRLKRMGADIRRRAVRHVLGRVFATIASVTLELPVYDSQCGAKLFRASMAAWIFDAPFVSTWCFDVEILARITARLGAAAAHQAVIELPLGVWHDVHGSKVRLHQMAMMPIELLRIRARYAPK